MTTPLNSGPTANTGKRTVHTGTKRQGENKTKDFVECHKDLLDEIDKSITSASTPELSSVRRFDRKPFIGSAVKSMPNFKGESCRMRTADAFSTPQYKRSV